VGVSSVANHCGKRQSGLGASSGEEAAGSALLRKFNKASSNEATSPEKAADPMAYRQTFADFEPLE